MFAGVEVLVGNFMRPQAVSSATSASRAVVRDAA